MGFPKLFQRAPPGEDKRVGPVGKLVTVAVDVGAGLALAVLGVSRASSANFEGLVIGIIELLAGAFMLASSCVLCDALYAQARFLTSWAGKGVIFVLFGTLSLRTGGTAAAWSLPVSGIIIGVGLIYVVLGCMCLPGPAACIDCRNAPEAQQPPPAPVPVLPPAHPFAAATVETPQSGAPANPFHGERQTGGGSLPPSRRGSATGAGHVTVAVAAPHPHPPHAPAPVNPFTDPGLNAKDSYPRD